MVIWFNHKAVTYIESKEIRNCSQRKTWRCLLVRLSSLLLSPFLMTELSLSISPVSPIACNIPQFSHNCPSFSCCLLYSLHISFPCSSFGYFALWSYFYYLSWLPIRNKYPNYFKSLIFNLPSMTNCPNSSLNFIFLTLSLQIFFDSISFLKPLPVSIPSP